MDKASKLRELHELKTSGILSDAEFNAEKNKILNEDEVSSPSPFSPHTPFSSPPPETIQDEQPLPPSFQQGGNGNNVVAIIVVVLVVVVVIGIILSAVLYVWAASFLEEGESAPIATIFVEKNSGGSWNAQIIKISKHEDLTGFSYFLKNSEGTTYIGGNGFGEVAMQKINGELHGIDISYNGGDNELQQRADNVNNDDGSDYPVHFSDNDRDGMLSAGDQFEIYGQGSSANGPAQNGWTLDIQFDPSGDIIGRATLQ